MKWHPFKWLIFGLLSVSVVANMVAIFASTQMDLDLTSPDYYERELNFEDTLQARRRAQAFSWQLEHDSRELRVQLVARGQAPMPSQLSAYMYRPQQADSDLEIQLTSLGSGSFRATLPTLDAGLWRITLRGTTDFGDLEHQSVIQR